MYIFNVIAYEVECVEVDFRVREKEKKRKYEKRGTKSIVTHNNSKLAVIGSVVLTCLLPMNNKSI